MIYNFDEAAIAPDGFCRVPCDRKLHMDDEALAVLTELVKEMNNNGDSGTMAGAVVILRRIFLGKIT